MKKDEKVSIKIAKSYFKKKGVKGFSSISQKHLIEKWKLMGPPSQYREDAKQNLKKKRKRKLIRYIEITIKCFFTS